MLLAEGLQVAALVRLLLERLADLAERRDQLPRVGVAADQVHRPAGVDQLDLAGAPALAGRAVEQREDVGGARLDGVDHHAPRQVGQVLLHDHDLGAHLGDDVQRLAAGQRGAELPPLRGSQHLLQLVERLRIVVDQHDADARRRRRVVGRPAGQPILEVEQSRARPRAACAGTPRASRRPPRAGCCGRRSP